MIFTKENFFKQFTKDQSSFDEIHETMVEGVNIGGANFIILMCAILIASIGLNMNATAVIIGAMLISPLMGPIISIGYSIGIFNLKLLKKSFAILGIEILISVTTATLYFHLSPISSAGSEILSRTSPNIWDVLIAFFGGLAGIIGVTRKKSSNVVPGVAIATALMPPLCTSGYGLATRNMDIFLGAGYLFFINSYFIALSTFIGVKLMGIPSRTTLSAEKTKKFKKFIIAATIIVTIPSAISAANMVKESINNSNLSNFIQKELPAQYVLNKSIDTQTKTIDIVVIGNIISKSEEAKLQSLLPNYNFKDYRLRIQQEDNPVSDIQSYLEKFKEQNSGFIGDLEINKDTDSTTPADTSSNNAINKQLQSTTIYLYKNYKNIKQIYSGILDNELPVMIIEYSSDSINQDEIKNYILSNKELKGTKVYFEKYDTSTPNTSTPPNPSDSTNTTKPNN